MEIINKTTGGIDVKIRQPIVWKLIPTANVIHFGYLKYSTFKPQHENNTTFDWNAWTFIYDPHELKLEYFQILLITNGSKRRHDSISTSFKIRYVYI